MARLPRIEKLQKEIEGVFRKVLRYDFTPAHSWEPCVVLFGSRASLTQSEWSDFDFIVEVPIEYSHSKRIYCQIFRARLVAMDRDLGRKVTTKNASNIEEGNDTVKRTDKKWYVDVSLRVAIKGHSVQQLETTNCLLQLYENLHDFKAAVVSVAGILRSKGAMPADRTASNADGVRKKQDPSGISSRQRRFSCWLQPFVLMKLKSAIYVASWPP